MRMQEQGEAKRWFTIQEAARYLEVSEPTLFRWMRDGSLTFYKVGGSTRFSQEGLDAVVRKSTGRTEAEANADRCVACGHDGLIAGRIRSSGRIYFHMTRTRFWSLRESLVGTNAKACPACGYIQLRADPEKLRDLMPRSKPEEAAAKE